ncbi:hypothetical protein ACFW0C_08970 [Aerococcus sp. NPDC058936]|uniref:hypothetical protein n=1 Tax=Aerococcus sp. NPDC058936 TaxID=3346674 RepID=UPI003670769D
MEKWQWFVENWFNVFTIIIASLSALYAFKANTLSKIANDNSKVANELSERANKIAEETNYNNYYKFITEVIARLKSIKSELTQEEVIHSDRMNAYSKAKSLEIYCIENLNKDFMIPNKDFNFWEYLDEFINDLFNYIEESSPEIIINEIDSAISELEKRL